MAIVSEEVLLGRVRRESAARAAELAKLRAELTALGAQIEERIDRLAARFRGMTGGKATESSALIESIRRVVAGEGYALAEIVDRLEARVGDNAAATAEEFLRTKVTATTALAEWGVILTARINENQAYAATTLRAYADTASALAEQVTELETTVRDPATGLVASLASATTTLSAHSTQLTSMAGRTSTLEAQVQTPGGGLLARVSTVESAKVDAAGAAAAATSVVSASLGSGAPGSIGAAVTTAANAYVTPLGEMGANWGVSLDINGRIAGRIKLDGTASTSTLDLVADKIRLYNNATDVAPFRLEGNTIHLQNVVVGTLDAGIHIFSPHIFGGELRLAGECLVCNTSDESLIRVNGGGDHGREHGGQLDLLGNGYAATSLQGSILLTPGSAAAAEVRIRDRSAADRIVVKSTGVVEVSSSLLRATAALEAGGGLEVGGGAHIAHDLDVDGDAGVQAHLTIGGALSVGASATIGGGVTLGGDSLISGQHKLHFDGTGNGTYIKESYGLQLWGTPSKPVQIMGEGTELHFGSSAVRLYVNGGNLWVHDAAGARSL